MKLTGALQPTLDGHLLGCLLLCDASPAMYILLSDPDVQSGLHPLWVVVPGPGE